MSLYKDTFSPSNATCKTLPSSSKTNNIGYWALYLKQFKKEEELFKYNLESFQEIYKVLVAMGDYYAAIADKPNAIINYKKSLANKKIEDIRKKLEKIQKK